MRSLELESARRDLMEWSHPVIADHLAELYAYHLGLNHPSLRVYVVQHTRVWAFILADQIDQAHQARGELLKLLKISHLSAALLDAINAEMLDELMSVVMARFHRSPRMAREYSIILLRAAASLADQRYVAA
jgi:hypothetical protein